MPKTGKKPELRGRKTHSRALSCPASLCGASIVLCRGECQDKTLNFRGGGVDNFVEPAQNKPKIYDRMTGQTCTKIREIFIRGKKQKMGPGKPPDFPGPVGRNFSWMEGAPPGAPVIPDCRSGSSRRRARPAGRSRTAGCGGQGQPFWLRLWRPFRPPRRQSRPRPR